MSQAIKLCACGREIYKNSKSGMCNACRREFVVCKIQGCKKTVYAHGLCNMHYLREYRAGTIGRRQKPQVLDGRRDRRHRQENIAKYLPLAVAVLTDYAERNEHTVGHG